MVFRGYASDLRLAILSQPHEDANPSPDATVEKAIRKENDHEDRHKNRTVPPGFWERQMPPQEEVSSDFESDLEIMREDKDFEELSSDKKKGLRILIH